MTDPKIAELLSQLHGKLEHSPALSPEDREELRRLAADIDSLLASRAGAADARHLGTLERLREAVVHFEATHPDLTVTLASVSKALGDMGI